MLVLNAVLSFTLVNILLVAVFLVGPTIFQNWNVGWPLPAFCAGPVVVWVLWSLLPMWLSYGKAHRGLGRAFSKTTEAYEQRAEYSLALNAGLVETVQPRMIEQAPEPAEAEFADEATSELAKGANLPPPPGPFNPGTKVGRVRVWNLTAPHPETGKPVDVPLYEAQIRKFLEIIFVTQNWTRKQWVGKKRPLKRMEYEAILILMTDMEVIKGRGQGTTGKLTQETEEDVLRRFGLEPKNG
jgi:hypothetical protein